MKKTRFLFSLWQRMILFSCCFFSLSTLGEVTVIPSEEVKRIVVKGPHWALKFKREKGPYRFKLKGPGSLQLDEEIVEVVSDNYKKAKKVSLSVTGPGVPLSLFAFQGHIQISHWQKPVFIFSQKGKIQGFKNKGPWQVSLKKGSIKLNQFTGSLTAKGLHLNTALKNLKGDFQIQFNEGRLKMEKGRGTLTYATDKGDVRIKSWKGDVRGESISGSLNGSLNPGLVQVFSKKGTIVMNFSGSRPLIKAFSESGKIRSPKYMNKKYAGKSLTVTGRLRGNGKKEGNVSLETDRGDIYIQ